MTTKQIKSFNAKDAKDAKVKTKRFGRDFSNLRACPETHI
jgi:hypothetical protein